MSHPAYKPSSAFSTKAKVAKGGGGGICGTLRYSLSLYILAGQYNFTTTHSHL